MNTLIVTFLVILAVVAAMAIGVIFGRRPITGSCGGLASLGLECDCDSPCPRKLARMRARAEAGGDPTGSERRAGE
ncbi:MAG: (Na+)-NQR maturation NqrM [Azoarcus sp.]|jgi:hypothetical protein|nr:(Na+)-NQR maturation NqrM [Azoarcus sp.]